LYFVAIIHFYTDKKHIVSIAVFGLFLIAPLSRAQTGPGGVGTSATNVLWLNADKDAYNNGGVTPAGTTDDVQQWNDQSGNARNATQPVLSYRPNYITNVVNGLPVLRFSGGNDHIMATGVATANVASVWAVAAYASLPSSNPGILLGAPAATGTNVSPANKSIGLWVSSAAGTQVWGRGIQSNGTSRDISQTTTLNGATFYIINNIYRSATFINQFVNSAAAGNNNLHNGTLSSWTDITIGRQASESWSGDIAEVIFYNTEVNAAQRILIDNYLAAKYGLALSASDIYDKDVAGNGNYDFEVAGIGRVDASNIHNSAQGTGIVRILNPGGLGDNEFLIWGHDNASLLANNLSDVPPGVQARMSRVWRVSEVNASSASVDVGSIDISFDLTGLGAITATDLRLLVDTDNDGVFTDETGISGASLISANIYGFTGVTAITNNVRFSLGTVNKTQTPLPVELFSFTARPLEDDQVELKWSTASEKNNAYFEVQRTPDGITWETLEQVKGTGNSATEKNYRYLDARPYRALSYYRLQQCDLDGGKKQSWIVAIRLDQAWNDKLLISPNPASDKVIIRGNQAELDHLQVFDAMGREICLDGLACYQPANRLVIDLSSWPKGIYYFKTLTAVKKVIRE
jgi:hypothetical protein